MTDSSFFRLFCFLHPMHHYLEHLLLELCLQVEYFYPSKNGIKPDRNENNLLRYATHWALSSFHDI